MYGQITQLKKWTQVLNRYFIEEDKYTERRSAPLVIRETHTEAAVRASGAARIVCRNAPDPVEPLAPDPVEPHPPGQARARRGPMPAQRRRGAETAHTAILKKVLAC